MLISYIQSKTQLYLLMTVFNEQCLLAKLQGGPKKWHPFNNFDESTPILTILSLLQQEIHGA